MLDVTPATRVLSDLVAAVRDDQLTASTPCAQTSVADMLDHIDGLTLAFAAAARKNPLEGVASADGSRLGLDWRPRISRRLADLADAWRDPDAWTGMTRAGGIDMPGEVAAAVVADELIVHGWDLAAASQQDYDADPALVDLALGFVTPTVAQNPDGTPGLFGPPITVPDNAPALHRLLALTGRDPSWTAVGAAGAAE